MATSTAPANALSLLFQPDPHAPNPLYPFILATVLLCSILTTITTAARLITKRLVSSLGVEDYFLIAGYVSNIAYNYLFLASGLSGLGKDFWNIGATGFPILAKYSWALQILYCPTIWLAKTALLFQLIYIFTPMKSGPVYWACHCLIWGNLAFYTGVVFSLIFECHPVQEVWNPFYAEGGHCINRNLSLVVTGAVNVFSDLLNLLIPLWAIWHLQMAPKRKAGVMAIFTIGTIAFVSSICRLVYSIWLTTGTDISRAIAQTGMWTLAEVASIILCTCFPMMPRLKRLIGDHYSRHKMSSGSPSTRTSKPSTVADRSYGKSSDTRGASTRQLESPYQHSRECDVTETSGSVEQVESTGIHEPDSGELTTRDRIERKAQVTSEV